MTLKSKGWGLHLLLKMPVKSQAISHSSVSQPQPMFQLQGRSRAALQSSPCISHLYPSVTGGEIPMWDPMRAEQAPAGKSRFPAPLRHCTRGSCTSSMRSIPMSITLGKVHASIQLGEKHFSSAQGGVKRSWSCPTEECSIVLGSHTAAGGMRALSLRPAHLRAAGRLTQTQLLCSLPRWGGILGAQAAAQG